LIEAYQCKYSKKDFADPDVSEKEVYPYKCHEEIDGVPKLVSAIYTIDKQSFPNILQTDHF
jgi:hypothetical protein